LVALVGFFAYRAVSASQNAVASQYQTSVVEIGDMTAFVGATGTVRANQTAYIA